MTAGRRRLLGVVGAAAAVVAICIVGIVVGRATSPSPDVVVVEGVTPQATPEASALPLGLPDDPNASVGTTVVLRPDDGLADSASIASGYRLSRAGIDPQEFAAALAAHLGVRGEPTPTDTGWQVGSAPVVTVVDDAAVSWTYDGTGALVSGGASSPPVTATGARAVAERLLSGIGVNLDLVEWQVDRTPDSWSTTAWQIVDGSRTSMNWKVDVLEDGTVRRASGFAGGLEELTGYPVVGAATAVRRTTLPLWGAVPPVLISAASADTKGSDEDEPRDRPALVVDVSNLIITQARLGLAQYRQADGQLLILPAYILTADDGSTWSAIAVSPDYVEFAHGAAPPSPAPGN